MDRIPQSKSEKLSGRVVCVAVSAVLGASAVGLSHSGVPIWAVVLTGVGAALYLAASVIRPPALRRVLLGGLPLV